MERPTRNTRKRLNAPDPRIMLGYFMGVLWIFGGFFVVFSKYIIGYDYFDDSDFVKGWMRWFLGFIFVLYGGFRIYRGYLLQKERNADNE
jgi:hypothetical protein